MSLKDLPIKISYKSYGKENIVDNLLIPALKESNLYKRSVGFFSSSVFEITGEGIGELVNNGGTIQIVCSPELSKEDVKAIELGYKKKESIIKELMDQDLERTLSEIDNDNLLYLIDLIGKNVLDVIVVDIDNNLGMYHDKIGLICDKEGNKVLFVGSPNESKNAYCCNYEKIRVSRSWIEGENERIIDDEEEFDEIWNGRSEYVKKYNFTEALKKNIIHEAKKRNIINDINKESGVKLRDYQVEAINAWKSNNNKGFFVMATGTGKTWTAIYAAKEMEKQDKLFLVICAPYKHLVKQWSEDIKKVFSDAKIVLVSSENHDWENELKDAVYYSKYTEKTNIIAISTIMSFDTERFKRVLNLSKQKKMLIVDEAHRFKIRDEYIHDTFDYLLGLSATPTSNPLKDDGSELMNYFGGKVFNLPIEFAIEKGYLVHYNYYPIFVSATQEEEEKFDSYSFMMSTCYKNDVCIDIKKLSQLKRSRLRVIAMAEEKENRISEILTSVKEDDHFIVYCGDGKVSLAGSDEQRHIEYVRSELYKLGYKVSQFTATEKMNERMKIVNMFNKGTIDAMVAIRCLDEGINIPSIKGALILASNDDYREFVQRRGRILRTYKDEYSEEEKEKANIYDVVVLPSFSCTKFAEIELRRVYEYLRLADNKKEYEMIIENYCAEYNIDINELTNMDEMEDELDE